jgi:hypothetical protein
MKKQIAGGLIAAMALSTAQPVMAAELAFVQDQRPGAFGGLRLRLPLDGPRRQRRLRAGVTIAPTMHFRNADGASRQRFGEGLELGLAGGEPVRLSLGGVPVSRLAQGPAGPDGARMGVSTLGWVAIGVGAAIVIVVAAGALCASDSDCIPSE